VIEGEGLAVLTGLSVHDDRDPTEFDEAAGFARGNDSIQVCQEQTNELVIRNVARRHQQQRMWPSQQDVRIEKVSILGQTTRASLSAARTTSMSDVLFPSGR
jgi:hypothetical protein